MRWILRQLLFHFVALWVTALAIPGFSISTLPKDIALAVVALSLINVFIKPIVKLFFLPLNIITLNLFSIIINVGVVFALTKLVSTVTISLWKFNGVTFDGFIIPEVQFTIVYTYVLVAFMLTTIVTFLNWLTK